MVPLIIMSCFWHVKLQNLIFIMINLQRGRGLWHLFISFLWELHVQRVEKWKPRLADFLARENGACFCKNIAEKNATVLASVLFCASASDGKFGVSFAQKTGPYVCTSTGGAISWWQCKPWPVGMLGIVVQHHSTRCELFRDRADVWSEMYCRHPLMMQLITFRMKTTGNPTKGTMSFVSDEEDTKGSVSRNCFLLFVPCFCAIRVSAWSTARFSFRRNALQALGWQLQPRCITATCRLFWCTGTSCTFLQTKYTSFTCVG